MKKTQNSKLLPAGRHGKTQNSRQRRGSPRAARFKVTRYLSLVTCYLLIILTLALNSALRPILAEELENIYQQRYQQLQENKAEQEKLRAKIAEAQNQERTLANQIAYINNQIHLTELQITETQSKIIETQEQLLLVSQDIDKLREKLTILDESLNKLLDVLNNRIRASYETQSISPLTLFLTSEDFSELILQYTYLKALQQEDKKLLTQMKDTRGIYLTQKTQLEALKNEKEELRNQLETQKATLENQQTNLSDQRSSKQYLLEVTKNEETKYQEILGAVQAEQRSIEQAVNEILQKITGRVLEGTHVNLGEIIGIQGSTGFATGDHLHFGYYPCGSWTCPTDPLPSFQNGTLNWPIDNPTISQYFGLTSFALTGIYGYDKNGNPKPHNGLDMYGEINTPIKASHSGTVYYSVDGWGGHGAVIQDESGFMTIYWHLQPKK